MEQTVSGMLILSIGVLSIVGAVLNWRMVVGPEKLIPRLLGPAGAKIFMILLGLGLIVFGILLLLGRVG